MLLGKYLPWTNTRQITRVKGKYNYVEVGLHCKWALMILKNVSYIDTDKVQYLRCLKCRMQGEEDNLASKVRCKLD